MENLKVDTAALRLIERDFERIVQEISKDRMFDDFKRNYNSLLDTLKANHEKERQLVKNCQELNDNINENAGKIKAVISIAQTDSQVIVNLKNELSDAKNLLMIQKEKDEASKKKIENLTKMWKNLESITKQNQELSSGKLSDYQKLLDERGLLDSNKSELHKEVEVLEKELKELKDKNERDSLLYQRNEVEYKKLDKLDIETEIQLKKNEERMRGNNSEIEQLKHQKKNTQVLVDEEKVAIIGHEKRLQEILADINGNIQKKTGWEDKRDKSVLAQIENNEKMEAIKIETGRLLAQKETLEQKLKTEAIKLHQLIAHNSQCDKQKNLLYLEIQKIEAEIDNIVKQKIILQNQFSDFSQRIENFKREEKTDQNTLELLHSNFEQLMKKYEFMVKSDETKVVEIRKLISENRNLVVNTVPLENMVGTLKKECYESKLEENKLVKDIAQIGVKLEKMGEELLLKDNTITELQRKINEYETKLKNQQKMYENVRNDRNKYSKSLVETQDEVAEIKKKLNITNDKITQLREDLELKEKLIGEELTKFRELEKQYKNVEKKNSALRRNKDNFDMVAKSLINQFHKFKNNRKVCTDEINEIQESYNKVIIERDILITKLVQKNDEIALINENLMSQETVVKESVVQHLKNENEHTFLRGLVKDLNRELKINTKKVAKVLQYQSEIETLNKQLADEKQKVKELSEELESPKNRSRWRQVGEIDQDIYELMQKIQDIQKKLIKKTEEIITIELDISTQDQTIENIKNILEKHPDTKEAQKFSILQKSVRAKTRKLKVS